MVEDAGNYRLAQPERELQAVAGAASDLWKAEEMLMHCVDTDTELHELCVELEEACWTASVVRYERAFACRPWPSQLVVLDQLSPRQIETHHYIRFLRDKMFAHAIGGVGEDFEVTAHVRSVYGGGFELAGVGSRPRYIVSPGTDLANEFFDLVMAVRALVDAYHCQLRNEALRRLQTVPLELAVKGRPVEQTALILDRASSDFQKYLRKALAKGAGTIGQTKS